MLDPRFVIVGAILNLIGTASYAVDTAKGRNRPNRITWVLWTIAPLIAFAGEVGQGVGIQSLTTFMAGFCPALVLLASFTNKKAYWAISRFDIVCGLISALALVLWIITKTGNIAIMFSIIADALAATPTLVKSYHTPESESSLNFFLAGVSGIITLLTLKNWTFAAAAFPLYIVAMCTALYVLIQFPRFRFNRRQPAREQ